MPLALGSFTNGFFSAAQQTMQLGQMYNSWQTQQQLNQGAAAVTSAMNAQNAQPDGSAALQTNAPLGSDPTDQGNSSVGPVTQSALPSSSDALAGLDPNTPVVDPSAAEPTDAESTTDSKGDPWSGAGATDTDKKSDGPSKKALEEAAKLVKEGTTTVGEAKFDPNASTPDAISGGVDPESAMYAAGAGDPSQGGALGYVPTLTVAAASPQSLPATAPPTSPAAAAGGPVTGSTAPQGTPVPALAQAQAPVIGGPPRTPGQPAPTMAGAAPAAGTPPQGDQFTWPVTAGQARGTPVVNPDTGQNADVETMTGVTAPDAVSPDTGKPADPQTMTGVTAPGNSPTQTSAGQTAPSLGARILGALNPISSAYGDEVPGGFAGGGGAKSALPPAKTDDDSNPVVPEADQKNTRALPPAAAPAVATTAPSAKVAPDQKGPTDQNEATPPITTPPLINRPWASLVKTNPQVAQAYADVASRNGISPWRLLNTHLIESGGRPTSPNSSKGAIGPMQIMPGTWDQYDPTHQHDISTLRGGLEVGAKIIKDCDDKFGQDTVASVVAYNAGPGVAQKLVENKDFSALPLETQKYCRKIFAARDLGSNNIQGVPQMDPAALSQAAQSGPAGMLNYIATSAAQANAPLTAGWQKAESLLVGAFLRQGNMQGAQQAQEFIMQQSRQGASLALMNADRALAAGDGVGAAQQLARAHAFFPDGAVGRFGVDSKGQVWAQTFSEQDPSKPIGKPFQITRQNLQPQLVVTQDPGQYLAAVKSQQMANAQAEFMQRHGDYLDKMANTKAQAETDRLQAVREKLAEDQQKAAAADATRMATSRYGGGALNRDPKADMQFDKEANTQFGQGTTIDGQTATPEQLSQASELYVRARRGGVTGATASNIAQGAASGRFKVLPDDKGGALVADPKSGRHLMYLPPEDRTAIYGPPRGALPRGPVVGQTNPYASSALPAQNAPSTAALQ